MDRQLLTRRLAAPRFDVNVRFDQQFMTRRKYFSEGKKKVKFGSAHTDYTGEFEVFDVKEGEILVTMKAPGRIRDGFARCFSSLNGWELQAAAGRDDETTTTYKDLMKKVQFLGVATTEHKASKIQKFDQGFVATVSGVVTVMNESGSTLHPGSPLTFDVAKEPPHQRGIPIKKSRFIFKEWKVGDTTPVVGKVLSYSKHKSTVDILLHPQRESLRNR